VSWLGAPKGDQAGVTDEGAETSSGSVDRRIADGPRTQALSMPAGLVRRAIATLDSGYFAFVMATGIVSIATDLLGYALLSEVILGFAVAGFVGLLAAYLARFVFFLPFVRQSAADPTTAMAYFTVVAGTDVLATRFVLAGHPLVAFGLGCGAALIWVGLTYGLPGSIVAGARRPVLREINGTWLLWVVATQSLSIVAAAVAPSAPATWLRADLPAIAICLWALGVMLYLVLIVIIFLRVKMLKIKNIRVKK
jgi:tellurite resistance protein TehA-like permease